MSWDSPFSSYEGVDWHRTAALKPLLPTPGFSGAASGTVWSRGAAADAWARQSAMTMERSQMGALFDGCENKTEMAEWMAAAVWDRTWKGVGVGVIVGMGLAATAIYFIKK